MKKRTLTLFCIAALIISAAVLPAFAGDTSAVTDFDDYSGPIDPYTGKTAGEGGDSGASGESFVYISEKMYYDREKERFAYPVGNTGKYIYTTIPAGAVITSAVSFEVPGEITVSLYMNGDIQDTSAAVMANSVGNYKLIANSGVGEVEIMNFSIVNQQTGSVEYYNMPDGFFVTGLTVDGEDVEPEDSARVDLTQEGRYEITYRCPKIDADFSLILLIDHTAPEVVLSGVSEGYADGPVTVESISEEAQVKVFFKGNELERPGTRFTKAGDYRLIAADPAGNVTTVDFTIKVYFNISAVVTIVIICVVAAVLAAYLIIRRKRMRVR